MYFLLLSPCVHRLMATEVSLLFLLFVAEEALKFNAGLHILEKMMQMAGIHVPKIAFVTVPSKYF